MSARAFRKPVNWGKRKLNRLLCALYAWRQADIARNKPFDAIFEMSSSCNLKCPLCNTGGLRNEFRHVERGAMKFSTFKAALDKLLPEIEHLTLYNWGEPFLNQDLFRCIEYATRREVTTQLSTNMMLLGIERAQKVIASGLTLMIVSCDGLTQETYGRYRAGASLEKLIAHVDELIALKRSLRSPLPRIRMQFIVFKHNEHEMDEFNRFWLTRGADDVDFIRMSFMSIPGEEIARKQGWIPDDPDYQPFHPYGTLKRCGYLYHHVTINYNGDWYTCCFPSGETDYRIGNLVTDDFWEVWNGEYYRYCRRLLREQRVPPGRFEAMCHDCTGVFPQREDVKRYWRTSALGRSR
jgi:radical SAM protein with 4Fe4S-binding SPASM domain